MPITTKLFYKNFDYKNFSMKIIDNKKLIYLIISINKNFEKKSLQNNWILISLQISIRIKLLIINFDNKKYVKKIRFKKYYLHKSDWHILFKKSITFKHTNFDNRKLLVNHLRIKYTTNKISLAKEWLQKKKKKKKFNL